MDKADLNLTELKLQVLEQFSSTGSLKEPAKSVLPLLLDLSKFFETQKNAASEEELEKMKMKINAVEMKNDEDGSGKSSKEDQAPLEAVFEQLLSASLKGAIRKMLLLKEKKGGLKKEEQPNPDLEEKTFQADCPTSPVREIKPLTTLPKNIDLYEKIFTSASNLRTLTEGNFSELLSQPFFSSILEKHFLKKKNSKNEKDSPKKAPKENQDNLSF